MKKNIKLEDLPNFINKIVKNGGTITRCVKNGKINGQLVYLEWKEV